MNAQNDRGWEYWDNKASDFDRWSKKIVAAETEQRLDSWLLSKRTPKDRVLELGCGTGRYSRVIANSVGQLIAADQSPAMLEVGRGAEKTGRTRECDCSAGRLFRNNRPTTIARSDFFQDSPTASTRVGACF
jgi:ubiquinone/menaquinone biosynthesis C-methylase UbiE